LVLDNVTEKERAGEKVLTETRTQPTTARISTATTTPARINQGVMVPATMVESAMGGTAVEVVIFGKLTFGFADVCETPGGLPEPSITVK
jgi:hypothetical protein